MDIVKSNFYDFKVHKGALIAYEEIKPQLMCINPQKIAGYSIGALIGILYAYDLWKVKGIKVPLFLIGAPPIGNKKFRKEFNSIFKSIKYTNHNSDIIANSIIFSFILAIVKDIPSMATEPLYTQYFL